MQLLLNCEGLQELHLQLVDTLDDPLWEQVVQNIYTRFQFSAKVASANSLQHLVSVTFDQCHGISATILFSEFNGNAGAMIDLTFCRLGRVRKPTGDAERLVVQVPPFL